MTAAPFDSRIRLRVVAECLNFPTSVAFDAAGEVYVAESGLPFDRSPPGGRVLKVGADGGLTCLREGLSAPVNGLLFHDGCLYISEGGNPGRISRLSLGSGELHTILDDLPGGGNYHTNMAAIGPDGKLYFSQGALTNSGVVGLDAYNLGWLGRLPHPHDIPGLPITLTGVNFETNDPRLGRALTSAFAPFGTSSQPNQRIPAGLPCTAAVMRCNLDGSGLELVAWGLRNAYGLGFLPDGRLLCTDQGADDRGSRPLGHVPDLLFEVLQGRWYGWPDHIGDRPVTDPEFTPSRGPRPTFLLANHAELPPPERPLLRFPEHAAAAKFAVSKAGDLIVALFGDEAPMTAPEGPRVGRSLARIDTRSFTLHRLDMDPLYRPIDVRFHPLTGAMYVLDFGEFEMEPDGAVAARAGTGKLYQQEEQMK